MYDIYTIARGPLAWSALMLFAGGCLYRLILFFLDAAGSDRMVFSYFRPYYAMRSLAHWIIPFGSAGMRSHPVFTTVAFVFHTGLLTVPLFLFPHVILLKESWNISWCYLPQAAADVLTVAVILSCGFFLLRRLLLKDIRYLSSASDFFLLILVAAPFITGFWAGRRWYGYEAAVICHMLTGEMLLAAIPFTRLNHMLFFFLTRGYSGSEFGGVRHARDW